MQIFRMNWEKSSEKKDGKKDIYFVLLPMILGICLCVACFVSTTFAWYEATQTTSIQPIQAATCTVTVSVVGADDTAITAENGIYHLERGTYAVTLTAFGGASTGYCTISLTDASLQTSEYHTVQIPTKGDLQAKIIAFSLTVGEGTDMSIASQWGHLSQMDGKWENGEAYIHPIVPPSAAEQSTEAQMPSS